MFKFDKRMGILVLTRTKNRLIDTIQMIKWYNYPYILLG